jgi:hypothetical protein
MRYMYGSSVLVLLLVGTVVNDGRTVIDGCQQSVPKKANCVADTFLSYEMDH